MFIDARHLYNQIDRAHRNFLPEQIEVIANIVRLYREDVETVDGSEHLLIARFPDRRYDWDDWPSHGDDFDFDLVRVETIVCQDVDVCWLW